MTDYETRRAQKIAHNQALLKELQLDHAGAALKRESPAAEPKKSTKRRKITSVPRQPARTSARIASAPVRPSYNEDDSKAVKVQERPSKKASKTPVQLPVDARRTTQELEELQMRWISWEPTASPPTRDDNGTFHFDDTPDFIPNKSPAEVLKEGCFGGTYFRPLYSSTLAITVSDDWKELPPDWIEGVSIEHNLISSTYEPSINKFGVKCGQTIEEWEANGWINHDFDVRGWFQWYCRFFLGRRCDDDERQIGRWARCVGDKGRWRRVLLKKYVAAGIRSVTDEGDDEIEGVSPAIHQTCHHWAWEVRQDILDRAWNGA
ncbi:vegetatible incompatibility protein HET-E-1 [Venturia nashicola]|uniref:Vegetatible incompatibility protein HET-E-1 n=1 Tax=Venturia nashicola TaxID=86259 RepID=A0A4Z1P273_9PEZI|nr:vegetatible incompatibility protein HET-E-1 [Venturia nashicola]TLD35644.1 vegetatible incompatibility protein HET-E-1 [Venturia nashicola]